MGKSKLTIEFDIPFEYGPYKITYLKTNEEPKTYNMLQCKKDVLYIKREGSTGLQMQAYYV